MTLTCDRTQPRHYGDGNGRYWSVSQVIDLLTGRPPLAEPTPAMERGALLHQVFAIRCRQRLGEALPDPLYTPDLEWAERSLTAWAESVRPLAVEQPVRHQTLPLAGTPDLVCEINGRVGVLDLKTGAPQPWHAIQVEAYARMIDRATIRWVLYCDPATGSTQLTAVPPREHARNWAMIQAAVHVLQARERLR